MQHPSIPENIQALFMAADQFNILGLQWRCLDYLIDQLCPENCIGIGRFSSHFHCPKLHENSHAYIRHHFHKIASTSEELLDLNRTEFEDLINKDDLVVKREEAVFEATIKWIEHNPNDRRQHISTLLPKVRLALIHTTYLMNNVVVNIHIQHNKECMNIVTSVLKTKHDLNANGSSSSDFMNPLTRPRLPSAILLAVGGYSSSNPTNAMEAYDCRVDRWIDITYDMESPRAYHGTSYLNGYVYLVGGFNGMDFLNSVRRFDPVKKIWKQVAPMNRKQCYVSTAVLQNRLYAMGGFDGHIGLKSAECYEPETNQWNRIAPMNNIRSNAKATTLNGKTFEAEYYDRKTNEWYDVHNMNIHRSALDCCILPGLPNVRDYTASQDTFYREEARRALSDSSL